MEARKERGPQPKQAGAAGRPEGSQSTRWEGNPPGTFSRTNPGRPSGPLHLLDPLGPSSVESAVGPPEAEPRRREPGLHNIFVQGQLLEKQELFKELDGFKITREYIPYYRLQLFLANSCWPGYTL